MLGLPQGLVLSPILFNIYFIDLNIFKNNLLRVYQYAENKNLWLSNKNIDTVITNLNISISAVVPWFKSNEFKLAFDKSTTVFFSRRRNIQRKLS